MFFNVFGEKVSKARYKEMVQAQKNRRELVAAGLSRRELAKMGLLAGAGLLVTKSGLSARALAAPFLPVNQPASPAVRAFIEEMPIMPIKKPVGKGVLKPAPSATPLPGEGRTRPHQAFDLFPPQKFYQVEQRAASVSLTPDLPLQTMWGYDGQVPGPTYVANYGEPVLVRNFNSLPADNGGFGIPSVSTHLHNGHTPSESDGFPCDYFESGQFYDQHYPNVLAGILSTHPGTGDINESMSTLWYHDHRVDFTAQNVYKGLAGFYLLFNQFDTGNEETGFRLPSFPKYDIPMIFSDKVFDEDGQLFFDLFSLDGVLGDTFLVNGKVQPFLKVKPRKYRFRWLDGGPSRFYELFLTDTGNLSARNMFWVLATDGNILPRMVQTESARFGVAERVDVIIDFSKFRGQSVYLENRLRQVNGKGPVTPPNDIAPAGQGNLLVRFDVSDEPVDDVSVDPAFFKGYDLPDATEEPRVVRTFRLDRLNGQWSINGQFFECTNKRFAIKQNTAEHWILTNFSGDWQHPMHIHFEEHQILSRNRKPSRIPYEIGRKDVIRVQENERVQMFFRFRDFLGRYPMHCHNLVHEDHAMMIRWDIEPDGDINVTP